MATIKNKKSTPNYTQASKPVEKMNATINNNDNADSATKPMIRFFPWILGAFIFVLSFFLYTNTFNHQFVLDDHGIIKANKITKAPVSWENTQKIFTTPLRKGDNSDLENSLYRPFVKLLFNIQWNQFDGKPGEFHKVNVLFYAITCFLLFFVLFHAFKRKWVIPFLVTLLFAVHPVHTEVVANIKSMDEILGLMGLLIALLCIHFYIQKEKVYFLVLGAVGFCVGLYSKETTVAAVAIIPLFIYYFYDVSVKKNITISSVFAACTGLFLLCRQNALVWELQKLGTYKPTGKVNALDNFMALCPDWTSQFASSVATLGKYIELFFYPYPLSCDYSYKTFEAIGMGHPRFILVFLLFLGFLVFTIYSWRKKHIAGFGMLWFFISIVLVSNVFFLIGSSFSDRFLFVPSLGLALAFIYTLYHYFTKDKEEGNFAQAIGKSPLLFGVVTIMSIFYAIKTVDRNEDWARDFKLYSTDLENFPDATHLLFYLGNHLSSSEYAEGKTPQEALQASKDAIVNLTKSLSIYPALPSDGYNQLGKAYFNNKQLDSAEKYYRKALAEDSTNAIFINNLGTVYYNTNRLAEAFPYFVKAAKKDTTESDFMNNVGCVYGATQRPDSAIYWFKKASANDSLDATSLNFLNVTYRAIGQIELADYYQKKLKYTMELKESIRLSKL